MTDQQILRIQELAQEHTRIKRDISQLEEHLRSIETGDLSHGMGIHLPKLDWLDTHNKKHPFILNIKLPPKKILSIIQTLTEQLEIDLVNITRQISTVATSEED